MLGAWLIVANVNLMWYAVPLIVAISLVYSATRHEAMNVILVHSARLALTIALFMAVIMAVLAYLTWRL